LQYVSDLTRSAFNNCIRGNVSLRVQALKGCI
jgi:hypothetical protein